jgi:hypothetical protein
MFKPFIIELSYPPVVDVMLEQRMSMIRTDFEFFGTMLKVYLDGVELAILI